MKDISSDIRDLLLAVFPSITTMRIRIISSKERYLSVIKELKEMRSLLENDKFPSCLSTEVKEILVFMIPCIPLHSEFANLRYEKVLRELNEFQEALKEEIEHERAREARK